MMDIIRDYVTSTYKVRKIKLNNDKRFTRCIELRTGEFVKIDRSDKGHMYKLIKSDISDIFGISTSDAEEYLPYIRY